MNNSINLSDSKILAIQYLVCVVFAILIITNIIFLILDFNLKSMLTVFIITSFELIIAYFYTKLSQIQITEDEILIHNIFGITIRKKNEIIDISTFIEIGSIYKISFINNFSCYFYYKQDYSINKIFDDRNNKETLKKIKNICLLPLRSLR